MSEVPVHELCPSTSYVLKRNLGVMGGTWFSEEGLLGVGLPREVHVHDSHARFARFVPRFDECATPAYVEPDSRDFLF